MRTLCVTAGAIAALLTALPAKGDSVEDFYRNRTIDLYIGFSPGGGFDLYARTVGRFMGNHIPGKPRIVPKNMTGAGSRTAVGYVYNVAPKDGSVLATADQSLPTQQAIGDPTVKFDSGKLIWIGNPNADNNTLAVWHTTGVTTIEQAKHKAIAVGATGANTSAQYPQAMNTILGTKFKIVSGYPGAPEINLAMERGELGGRGSNAWASWKVEKPEWLREHKINILVQIGLAKASDLPDVPLMMDLATNPEDHAALKLLSAATAIGRPLFTTPGVPAERVAALRKAFAETMTDPDFLAETQKLGLPLNPILGEQLQKIVDDILATPKPIGDRLMAAIEGRDVVELPGAEKKEP